MPERDGNEPYTGDDGTNSKLGLLGRRRLLKLTGLGIAGTALTQQVSASSHVPHVIVFDGSGTSRAASYEFGVSDAVEPHGDVGALESDDTVDGTSVVGAVQGDTDAYRFGGYLTMLDVSGDIDVSIQYADTTTSGPDRLEIVTPSDGSVEYTFVCDGQVEKVFDNGRNSAESGNDTVTENGDGTYTVAGLTGNGYGDTYDLHGDVTSFESTTTQFTLLLNGNETTVAELTGQDDSGSGTDDGSDTVEVHTAEIVAENSVEYRFHTSGELTKVRDVGRMSAERNNDSVRQNDDGTWTAEGMTGNGYGDTYEFEGEMLSFEILTGDCVLYIDGEEVDLDQGAMDEVLFRVGFPHAEWLDYRLHLEKEPEPLSGDEDEYYRASNYDVSQFSDGTWLVEGRTGTADPSGPTYGDGYRWSPDSGNGILGWDASAGGLDYVVSINDQEIDPSTLPAFDPPEEQRAATGGGDVIGGGSGYSRIIDRSQADYTASSWSELGSALDSASSGDVVYVTDDIYAGLGDGANGWTVPAGVTVAGDRGLNGSSGPVIHNDDDQSYLLSLGRNARLTGVTLRGFAHDWDFGSSGGGFGVSMHYDGAELDNCEVCGFGHAAIRSTAVNHVHHNYIHSTNTNGLGYGVVVYGSRGNPTIEYNYFHNNRHSVAASGDNYGYVCRYNHFSHYEWKHVIDVHDPAATETYVQNNIVEAVEKQADGGTTKAVAGFHEAPDDVILIENNWMYLSESDAFTDDGWRYADIQNNHYGAGASVSFSDIIPGHPGADHCPW